MFFKGLASFLQLILDAVAFVLNGLFALLPKSPFSWVSASPFSDLLSKINYFIPVSDFLTLLEAWLLAIGVYYLYSVWARWVKAID